MIFGQLAKNTFFQVVAKVVVVFVSFILIRAITESLGKTGYGIYGFVTAVVLLFATIADWGTSVIAVREASQKKDIQEKIFGTAFAARLVLSLIAFLLVNVFVRVYAPWEEYIFPLTVGSFVLLFLSVKTSMSVVFQTLLKFELSSVVEIIGATSFLILVVTVFLLGGGMRVNDVILAWVLSTIVAALVAFWLGLKLSGFKFEISTAIFKRLFSESLPMGAFLVFFSIYNRVDIVILEYFKGVEDVAIYNLAYKVHDNLVLGAAFLMASAFPVISRMYANPGAKRMLMSFYKKLFAILAVGGLLVAFVFYIAAPIVIQLLTGREFLEFTDSVMALRILVFATFISYLNHLTGYSLIAFGKQKLILLVGVVALAFNVTANIIFIPFYSWTAAAVITVLTELIVFSLTFTLVSVKMFKTN